jgi:hypothetical protein
LFAVLALFVVGSGSDCEDLIGERVRGSGNMDEEIRTISGISGVNLATLGKLYIELGREEKLVIKAEDNLLEYFETDVRNGVLTIDTRRNINIRPRKNVRYYLTVKELESIKISSSGDIEAPDLKTDRLKLSVSSSGDLRTGELDVESLNVRVSSSGDIFIPELQANTIDVNISSSGDLDIDRGNVEKQDVFISSSGNYQARNLESREARVRISSSGDAYLSVEDYLYVRISSSGNLYYSGNPRLDQSSSSSGRVKKR